jgi:hypothetical protein
MKHTATVGIKKLTQNRTQLGAGSTYSKLQQSFQKNVFLDNCQVTINIQKANLTKVERE